MSFTNVKNLTTFGGNPVKIIRLLSFPSVFESPNQPCERRGVGGGGWGVGGMKKGEGSMSKGFT